LGNRCCLSYCICIAECYGNILPNKEGFFEKIVVSAIIKQKNSRAAYENFCFRHLNSMPRKKLMYVPGLISLMALPILLLIFSPEDAVDKVALRMFLPSDDTSNGLLKFSKYSVLDAIKGKKLVTIYLIDKRPYYGDFRDEEYIAKLNFVAKEMERLQFTNDTSTVLKVVFDEDFEYGHFVHLINLTLIYNVKRWAFLDNSFYFFANRPPIYGQTTSLPIAPVSIDSPDYDAPTGWELFRRRVEYLMEEWKYYLRHNYLLTVAFIFLILLPGILGAKRIRKTFPALHTKPSEF